MQADPGPPSGVTPTSTGSTAPTPSQAVPGGWCLLARTALEGETVDDWTTIFRDVSEDELYLLSRHGNNRAVKSAARRERARRGRYDKMALDRAHAELTPFSLLVEKEDGCPNCGECVADLLVWREDDDGIECRKCGHYYELD